MPLQHSYCLSLLADYAKPGMSVLDVGSGSGYLTAVFGLMVLRTLLKLICLALFIVFDGF